MLHPHEWSFRKVNLGLIVLKNSAAGRRWVKRQNIFPPRRHSANMVYKREVWRNSVPLFRGDFRIEEFFNTINPVDKKRLVWLCPWLDAGIEKH
jgi:hypothetical protein